MKQCRQATAMSSALDGQAFSVRFNPDNHFLAAAGGHGTAGIPDTAAVHRRQCGWWEGWSMTWDLDDWWYLIRVNSWWFTITYKNHQEPEDAENSCFHTEEHGRVRYSVDTNIILTVYTNVYFVLMVVMTKCIYDPVTWMNVTVPVHVLKCQCWELQSSARNSQSKIWTQGWHRLTISPTCQPNLARWLVGNSNLTGGT